MPDEVAGTAVAEPEVQETQQGTEVAGTSEADAGREPEPQGEQAGQSQSGKDEGTPPDPRAAFFKDMTPDEFDRWVQTAPAELKESSAALKEIDRRGEQRGAQSVAEAQQKAQAQKDLYDDLIGIGQKAEEWLAGANADVAEKRQALAKALRDEDTEAAAAAQTELDAVLDSEEWQVAPLAIANAARLTTARQHSASLREALGKYTPLLGELTADEQQYFADARKHDGKNGTAMAQGILLDLIVGKAIELGEKRGRGELEKNAAADDALLKRVDGWMKAKGGVPPAVGGLPAATAQSDAEILADPHTPIDKIIEIRSRQQRG